MLKQSAESTPAIYIQAQRRARQTILLCNFAFRLNAVVGRQNEPSARRLLRPRRG